MYRLKYYLKRAVPLLFILPVLAAAEIFFGAFYPAYNIILLFLALSCVHNLFNKRFMISRTALVDAAAAVLSVLVYFTCARFQLPLYSGAKTTGILILICLNQLFMHSRDNYKERVSVRKGLY